MKPNTAYACCGVAALCLAAQAQAAPFMYIPAGSEIVVVDLQADRIVNRIPELENAHGLAATPDGEVLVAGSMQRITGSANKPATVKDVEHEAHHAAGQAAATSYVSIVQRAQNRVVRRIPVPGLTHHTAVSPDGKVAIAVHNDFGGISIIDLRGMAVTKSLKTGAVANYAVFSPDGRNLYVTNAGDGTVSDIDTAKWEVTRLLTVGKMPEHMTLSAKGDWLYVLNVLDGTVSRINLPDGRMTRTFKVGKSPHAGALSRDEKILFVSNNGDGTVSRIDVTTGDVRATPLGASPYHVEFVNATNTLYVSSKELPKIWALDPVTLRVRDEINLGTSIGHQTVVLDK